MGTNLNKKNKQNIVHVHKARVKSLCEFYDLTEDEALAAINMLDENLKYGYTKEVMAELEENKNISKQVIRHVKAGTTKNPLLFNFLLDFAIKCKFGVVAAQKGIKEKLTA